MQPMNWLSGQNVLHETERARVCSLNKVMMLTTLTGVENEQRNKKLIL